MEAAGAVKDVYAARAVLTKPTLRDGSITAVFERVGEEKVMFSHQQCHDPSHGGSYMAEGAFYIRIGLPPRVVSGDCLALFTD